MWASFSIAFVALAGAAFMVGCLFALLREGGSGSWSVFSPIHAKRKNYQLLSNFQDGKPEIKSHHESKWEPLYQGTRRPKHPRLVTLDIHSIQGLDWQPVTPRYRWLVHERRRG
jgi:hypothetical protein